MKSTKRAALYPQDRVCAAQANGGNRSFVTASEFDLLDENQAVNADFDAHRDDLGVCENAILHEEPDDALVAAHAANLLIDETSSSRATHLLNGTIELVNHNEPFTFVNWPMPNPIPGQVTPQVPRCAFDISPAANRETSTTTVSAVESIGASACFRRNQGRQP